MEWVWPTRRMELTDVPVLLSAAEVHAVADTDPIALRMLLSPDYNGIATSFARLLMKVVQRCKRVGQVDKIRSLVHSVYTQSYGIQIIRQHLACIFVATLIIMCPRSTT